MSKYDPLIDYFSCLGAKPWHASFEDIDKILGFPQPASVCAYPAWWANSEDMPHKGARLYAGGRPAISQWSMK